MKSQKKQRASDLKPCPFCGRIPTIENCKGFGFFAKCKCGIEQSTLYGQKCDAVRRWNIRKEASNEEMILTTIDAEPNENGNYVILIRDKETGRQGLTMDYWQSNGWDDYDRNERYEVIAYIRCFEEAE